MSAGGGAYPRVECDRRVKAMGVSFRRACRTGEEGGEKVEESAREGERER